LKARTAVVLKTSTIAVVLQASIATVLGPNAIP
jgi:hypothetical protein